MSERCARCGVPVTPETGCACVDLHMFRDGRVEERVLFVCKACVEEFRRGGSMAVGNERTVILGEVGIVEGPACSCRRSSGKRRYHRHRRHH
jgi:hypothetical protein